MKKRLYKIEYGRKLCGVCGGIAEYFDWDPGIVRIVWALMSFWGPGLIVYIIAAIVLPNKSEVV